MIRIKIGTKIISAYVLFALLILSFLGVLYWLVAMTVTGAKNVYTETDKTELALEAENLFWKQVALTDFLLLEKDEYVAEFHQLEKALLENIKILELSLKNDTQKKPFLQFRSQYKLFVTSFDRSARLHKAGNKSEAMKVQTEGIDPAEHEVKIALEKLIDSQKLRVEEAVRNVRLLKKYARVIPLLSVPIDNSERIYNESQSITNSLKVEAALWKQVTAVTHLLAFDDHKYIAEFHYFGQLVQELLKKQKQLAEADRELDLIKDMEANHQTFSTQFDELATLSCGRPQESGAHRGTAGSLSCGKESRATA